ncbi:MAG: hypothetical protein MR411_03970 [Tenericutes bacterium]|nr:hypothetical protein [Mycoplasmatota bacterium]MDY3801466.1 hypothetical protein [Bacilli bacterium]
MNVIIANKYQTMLQSLNIDVIKVLTGEFEVDDIISSFQNFYFQRMIIDVTAIKNYRDIRVIQKLSISLDMEKVILLLDDSPETNSSEYLSQLISMGIYNFTKNIDGVLYLYNNPNSYRDVAHIHQIENESKGSVASGDTRIIGIKGVTKESGATTLTYLMKNELENYYSVAAIEVDKRDFMFLRGKNLVSSTSVEIGNTVAKYSDCEVILIDVNTSSAALELCHDVIYLIEPSIIKLNRVMMINAKSFKDLASKNLVLNKSLLNNKDVMDFEYESRLKVMFNMPPLNDRDKNIPEVNELLKKMGFDRQRV